MSVLPNQIPNIGVQFLDQNGKVSQNWWLFFYNISQQALGNQGNTAAAQTAQLLGDLDADAVEADVGLVFDQLSTIQGQITPQDVASSIAALQMLPDLPDPTPAAQKPLVITPGASPYTYTAPFAGALVISGGTVSAVTLGRAGSTYTVPVGVIPVSRNDTVQITYSAVPTVAFLSR